jgi:hypothetical protein
MLIDDYCEVERGQILLVREVLIAGQENVKLCGSESEELAVSLAGPHLWERFSRPGRRGRV